MLEIAYSVLGDVPAAAVTVIVAGLLRSVKGWFENSHKDGNVNNATDVRNTNRSSSRRSFVLDASTSVLKKVGK